MTWLISHVKSFFLAHVLWISAAVSWFTPSITAWESKHSGTTIAAFVTLAFAALIQWLAKYTQVAKGKR